MILIDDIHLVSDESLEELHAFAERIGLKRCWFQRGHYDVKSVSLYCTARDAGAVHATTKELVRRMVGRTQRRRRRA